MKKLALALLFALCLSLTFVGGHGVAAAKCADNDVLCNGGTASPCANPNAQGAPKVCADNATGSKTNPVTGPNGVLTKVTNLLSFVVGLLAVFMVIVSGIRMITSDGDAAGFKSARTGLLYALLGLAISVLARAIVLFILNRV